MRRVFIWLLEFALTLALIMVALLAYDVYKHGMDYAGTPAFDRDLGYDGRIALTCAILIFLVDVCYVATRKTMRMGPPNDPDIS